MKVQFDGIFNRKLSTQEVDYISDVVGGHVGDLTDIDIRGKAFSAILRSKNDELWEALEERELEECVRDLAVVILDNSINDTWKYEPARIEDLDVHRVEAFNVQTLKQLKIAADYLYEEVYDDIEREYLYSTELTNEGDLVRLDFSIEAQGDFLDIEVK